jgi:long-chain acyl-CoA synthetase
MIQVQRLFDIPYHQLKNYPNSTMFVTKTNGVWNGMKTADFVEKVNLLSRGLISLGINSGDRVAVSSNNRVEWNLFDIAVQQIGAITSLFILLLAVMNTFISLMTPKQKFVLLEN